MIDILYISSFLITGIILYLLMNDLKNCKNILYNKIYYNIWVETYIILVILFIHFIWILSQLFLDIPDKNLIYGLPNYIYLPYILFILVKLYDFFLKKEKPEEKESIVSKKINKLINYLFIIYVFIIVIFISIPVNTKKYVINYIKKILDNYLLYK
jgi:hypothetical protein